MFRKFLLTAMVAVVAALVAPATSHAAFVLKLDSSGTGAGVQIDLNSLSTGDTYNNANLDGLTYSVTDSVVDNGEKTVSLSITFRGYTIGLSSNMTNTPGAASGALLWLSNTNIRKGSSATGDLTLTLSATDYTLPIPKELIGKFDASFSGASNPAIVQETASFDGSNALFGAPVASTLNYNADVLNNPETTKGAFVSDSTPNTPYSLTVSLNVSGMLTGASNQVQGDVSATVVAPAPAGLVMAVTALPFVGLLRRRLRKSEVVTAA